MEIINLRPANKPSGGMCTVAHFDLQVTSGIRLYALRLMEAPDGNRFTYAAECGNRRSATFERKLAEQITAAASKQLEAVTAHDIHSHSAT